MSKKGTPLFTSFGMSPSTSPPPSIEFLCPISYSLMADPVILPTGHTFERACIDACKELNFVPSIIQTSLSEFLSFILIPNSILKSLILQWCSSIGCPNPLPISRGKARGLVQNLKGLGLSSATSPSAKPPSMEFLCPLSWSLMADPVIIPTGHTFERACIEACKELNFVPPILRKPLSEFLSFILIPNSILKSLILQWCDSTGNPYPLPISQEEARGLVQNLKAIVSSSVDNRKPSSRDQGRAGEADHPRIARRPKTLPCPSYSSSMQEAQMATTNRLAFPSDSPMDSSIQRPTSADDASTETRILNLLQDTNISSIMLALDTLMLQRVKNSEKKTSFCNERILTVLIPLLHSTNEDIQIKTTTAVLIFTRQNSNRRNIVRWKAVPGLVHVLNTGMLKARVYAADAICNLAIEGQQNSMDIVSCNAVMPLLEIFYDTSMSTMGREKAGLAVHQLTLWTCNLDILEMIETAPRLHAVAMDKSCGRVLRKCAIMIMHNLIGGIKEMEELIEVDVLGAMSTMIREGEGMDAECMALMHKICVNNPVRFKERAIQTGVKSALATMKEEWGSQEKNMAKEMLEKLPESEESNEES